MINKNSLQHIEKSRKIIMQEENFAYILPCNRLKSFISNFTITFPNLHIISDAYSIMPHGSVTMVLFYYMEELHSFLFGPTTKPIQVGSLANQCDIIFIVEFQPAGFSPFTKINQKELTDQIIPFSFIDQPLDIELKNILWSSNDINVLLNCMEQKLLESILFPYPKELGLAIQMIIEKEGSIASSEVSKQTFYCQRHLNRLFNLYIGMSMKSFSRLVRINKSIRLLNEKENTLDTICEKLEYYDVSHFIKDFKKVCEITPQEYKNNMSHFYNEIAKF